MSIQYKWLIALVASIMLAIFILNQMNNEAPIEEHLLLQELTVKNDSGNRKKQIALKADLKATVLKVDYIVECSEDAYQYLDKDARTTTDLLNIFKNSKNHKSNLAFALTLNNSNLEQEGNLDVSNRITELLDLLQYSSNKSLIYYFLVAACNEKNSQKSCSDSIIPKAIENDSSNAALWIKIASYEASRNNKEGFEFAINQIIASPNYNEYWSDSIDIFNGALLDAAVINHSQRAIMSIGFSAAITLFNIRSILNTCIESAEQRPDIAQKCIDVGRIMSSASKSIVSNDIG